MLVHLDPLCKYQLSSEVQGLDSQSINPTDTYAPIAFDALVTVAGIGPEDNIRKGYVQWILSKYLNDIFTALSSAHYYNTAYIILLNYGIRTLAYVFIRNRSILSKTYFFKSSLMISNFCSNHP